jgi:UDP-glucose 6-dehydrogenase
MKIIVVGTGYVGLVHAAVCSEYGHEVYAYDIDKEKIEAFASGQAHQIEKHVNEPGLANIIRDTLGKSLFFSHEVENFGVSSNPEFLAEGTAVVDARRPDRVVVGCDTAEDFNILRRVYSQFVHHVRIKVIESLLGKGVAGIHAYDPLANDTARVVFDPSKNILFEKIKYFDSAKEAIAGTHALFISSDCEEFRGFSRTIEDTVKPPYLVMDGRRMIPDYGELVNKNYSYLAVGSMVIMPA